MGDDKIQNSASYGKDEESKLVSTDGSVSPFATALDSNPPETTELEKEEDVQPEIQPSTVAPPAQGDLKTGYYGTLTEDSRYSGWIEPEDSSWIIFLDREGRPSVYYGGRDAGGGVLGKPWEIKNANTI